MSVISCLRQKRNNSNILLFLPFIILFIISCQANNEPHNVPDLRSQAEQHWLPYIRFDPAKFNNPPQEFGPMVRWWWPGNNVTKDELKREVRLLAENGFSGAEIQPFSIGMGSNAPDSVLSKWYSWDTDDYYKNLQAVMEQAKESGLFIDMTAGSGWPLTTPVTTPKDGMKELAYAYTTVPGGKNIAISVSKEVHRGENSFRTSKELDFSIAKLQCVLAARVKKTDKETDQISLDPDSKVNIADFVSDGLIKWKVPEEGDWEIIAIYSIPTMEANPFAAKKESLLVVDHWDSTKIQAAYNYLFGDRTGLEKYYGDPFRAIFNDSYEFRSTVHFAPTLFTKFREENGYDIKPWLPQIMRGGNNPGGLGDPNQTSKFILTQEGNRLKYDFNRTLGDILIDQLMVGSDHWAEQRGMLHRTQPYGPVGLDVIKGAGHADIPEAEQLWDGGSEGFIKLVTSGAHLYNRPVISQESFVFGSRRAMMTTPQKLKALSGKSFTVGINQIIYHGFPYKLMMDNYGITGWSPFIPFLISSHINEANPFWEDIKKVNAFITRSQYVMRSGKHLADVLIYDPSITSLVGPNPKETLVGGYFKGVEPEAPHEYFIHYPKTNEKFSEFWQVINKLMASGITWDYVNDESLQLATMKNGEINIRGNSYKAIILPDLPYATLSGAKEINKLSKKGGNVLVIGDIPVEQPSFLDYKERDKKTYYLFKEAVQQPNGYQLSSAGLMDKWISGIPQEILFNGQYDFIRQSVRLLEDGSRLVYLWNMSGEWQTISLKGSNNFKIFYWLNPSDGTITADNNRNELKYHIPPYSSIILFAAEGNVSSSLLSEPLPSTEHAKEVTQIKKWDITIGDTTIANSSLFDWRNEEAFKYRSNKGIYSTSFDLTRKENQHYYLNLGKVYFTAKVWINGQDAGECIWSPYILDITGLLKSGKNEIKISVTPTLLNKLIGLGQKAKKGEPYYQFKDDEKQLMPAGLVGPVTIKSL